MSLTSEMSRTTAEMAAAQRERSAAIAKISSELRRKTHRDETALKSAMAAHRAGTKRSLRDIFGRAAFTRGAAEEMIERLRKEREGVASELWPKLNAYAANIRDTVGEEIAQMAAARADMASRERRMRRGHLAELRQQVEAVLASSQKLIEDLNHDRERAGQVWDQHVRNAMRQRQQRATKRTAAKRTPAPKPRAAEASTATRQASRPVEVQSAATVVTPVSE
jgi:hypothetical protein